MDSEQDRLQREAVERCEEAVDRGIKFLDEKVPEWRDKIDFDGLRVYSCSECMLGQIFDSFSRGMKELSISEDEAMNMGFDLLPKTDWVTLEEVWKERLVEEL